jgi:plastocyanin
LRAVSSPLLASTDITAFHIVGGLLAVWAVVLSAIGVTRHDFPGEGTGQKIVMAISALLVVGTVAAAIGTAEDAPHGEEVAPKLNKAGGEGTSEPEQGGGVAPGTGSESGQEPAGETGQPAPPGATVKTLLLAADPSGQLRFDKDALAAEAGNVRITMNNGSPVPHNVALEGQGVNEEGAVVEKGGSSEVEAAVKAGTYTFYCSVDGHRQAGMEGTLTIK